ncbi:hypothetical protein DFA_11835 [Cavenderia fasciculata]|uniref:glycerol kinase n=1 Tax=Cavenderia fasciculata TaxID=261658 RepID=F4QEC5_CACFS|nr:uncharacterized protein DFA_11835 [Cavenderia fasciculata]EGG14072.1 hypothetical protein DFA_11835 [Cavenderia fasciculata]|eukprot:XP_004350780.1 hypothetical protein DFA_11835 [Cavenderia fasciculata]
MCAMKYFIGIDLGTSGIKVIIKEEDDTIAFSGYHPLKVERLKPLWSEQVVGDWWIALDSVMSKMALQVDREKVLNNVRGIGLTGQMHSAVLLDDKHQVLRNCILWNDQRSSAECKELASKVENCQDTITGNIIMSGFTAPKILWLKKHEPDVFNKIDKVVLPKDYVRFLLSGQFATDMSDASGTMWLDVKKRQWSVEMINACGLTINHMPQLYESTDITGTLHDHLAERWGLPTKTPIGAGAGDNAAGAIGCGINTLNNRAMVSLGTSGVSFLPTDRFTSNTSNALHSFCHALPQSWHLMSVILNCTSCIDWVSELTGFTNYLDMIQTLNKENQEVDKEDKVLKDPIWFLPYLNGERTPHNNANLKGSFYGLTNNHSRLDLCRSVFEGVSFALADGLDVLLEDSPIDTVIAIGGGTNNDYWCQMLADITNLTLEVPGSSDLGPSFGAARLIQIATCIQSATTKSKEDIYKDIIRLPTSITKIFKPNSIKHQQFKEKRIIFKQLYQLLLPLSSK